MSGFSAVPGGFTNPYAGTISSGGTTTRYVERVYIYNGVRKIQRIYSHMIPEDFVMSMAKAEAAAFKMDEAVTINEYEQRVKNTVAFLNMEV